MNQQQLIKDEARALSGEDIKQLCDGKVRILTYPSLAKFNTLTDALGEYQAMVCLYETHQSFGHWTACFITDNNEIEFFDSYSGAPDSELKYVDMHFRKANNEYVPHLSYLIKQDGRRLIYNKVRLQQMKNSISTCGRWSSARIMLRQISLPEFQKYFKVKGLTMDEAVTAFTNRYLSDN